MSNLNLYLYLTTFWTLEEFESVWIHLWSHSASSHTPPRRERHHQRSRTFLLWHGLNFWAWFASSVLAVPDDKAHTSMGSLKFQTRLGAERKKREREREIEREREREKGQREKKRERERERKRERERESQQSHIHSSSELLPLLQRFPSQGSSLNVACKSD